MSELIYFVKRLTRLISNINTFADYGRNKPKKEHIKPQKKYRRRNHKRMRRAAHLPLTPRAPPLCAGGGGGRVPSRSAACRHRASTRGYARLLSTVVGPTTPVYFRAAPRRLRRDAEPHSRATEENPDAESTTFAPVTRRPLVLSFLENFSTFLTVANSALTF